MVKKFYDPAPAGDGAAAERRRGPEGSASARAGRFGRSGRRDHGGL